MRTPLRSNVTYAIGEPLPKQSYEGPLVGQESFGATKARKAFVTPSSSQVPQVPMSGAERSGAEFVIALKVEPMEVE